MTPYTVLLDNENHTYIINEFGQVEEGRLDEGKTAVILEEVTNIHMKIQ